MQLIDKLYIKLQKKMQMQDKVRIVRYKVIIKKDRYNDTILRYKVKIREENRVL